MTKNGLERLKKKKQSIFNLLAKRAENMKIIQEKQENFVYKQNNNNKKKRK